MWWTVGGEKEGRRDNRTNPRCVPDRSWSPAVLGCNHTSATRATDAQFVVVLFALAVELSERVLQEESPLHYYLQML